MQVGIDGEMSEKSVSYFIAARPQFHDLLERSVDIKLLDRNVSQFFETAYMVTLLAYRVSFDFCYERRAIDPSFFNNPRIVHANLGTAHNLQGSHNQTSANCGNKPAINRARKAARPFESTNPRSISHVKQFD